MFSQYGNFDWILIMDYDTTDIFSPIDSLRDLIIFATILITFCGLIIGYYLSRTISKPLMKLQHAAKEISKGNLDSYVHIYSNDEIGDLSSAFKNMIADLKRSRNKIENLLKQKDEFINQLGHDLKNPLTPLVNLLPIFEIEEKDKKKKDMLEIINRNVGFMTNLVTKTIELARLNSPNTEFDFEDTNLLFEMNTVIDMNKMMFKANKIKVINDVPEDIEVSVDKLRFEELLNNLLNNSVKYTIDPGVITINARLEEDFVTISISDTGIGMNEEQLSQVFNEFYKADSSRHDFDSSGLGMSICKRIVEIHGGRIWAESEGEDKGSTIYFTIPIRVENSKEDDFQIVSKGIDSILEKC
jgi:signal transduction histidine kinase